MILAWKTTVFFFDLSRSKRIGELIGHDGMPKNSSVANAMSMGSKEEELKYYLSSTNAIGATL